MVDDVQVLTQQQLVECLLQAFISIFCIQLLKLIVAYRVVFLKRTYQCRSSSTDHERRDNEAPEMHYEKRFVDRGRG